MASQQTHQNHNCIPYYSIIVMLLWLSNLGTQFVCSRALQPVVTENEESQVLAVPGSLISLSNCIFAELQALAAPSVKALCWGGGIVPAAVLSGKE